MNTDIITLEKINGTDSVSGSRITINNNFEKIVKAVGDIQTRIDTSKNTIYINCIETESGEFVIKTTPNGTPRFKIDNAGNLYVGNVLLDEYIRTIINNTKLVNLEITDAASYPMNFQNYAGNASFDNSIINTNVYYTDYDDSFTVKFNVDENVLDVYKHAIVYVYDPLDEGSNNGEEYQQFYLNEFEYTFHFNETNINMQRSISIIWIPGSSLSETYGFTLQKIS
ncbi:hypothetical protein [uncultured Methanobrevibacter sp.]|uniref:hypothetical protein n=1 Tax=uncultured Methanobrevibacter sp. TaxID=253161 RepID=UPI0025D43657|nr:hypothetical protein [uncultured Methanobrevibacter sp.]